MAKYLGSDPSSTILTQVIVARGVAAVESTFDRHDYILLETLIATNDGARLN